FSRKAFRFTPNTICGFSFICCSHAARPFVRLTSIPCLQVAWPPCYAEKSAYSTPTSILPKSPKSRTGHLLKDFGKGWREFVCHFTCMLIRWGLPWQKYLKKITE